MGDTIKSGLGFADPASLNFAGAKDEDISEYQQSLQDSIRALQMRYEQPNWFNVAAGFFKPQLGGFAASLGSASQAMGENMEKQRESQLPIAQMRSQLAMSKIAMGQNKTVADMEAARLRDKLPITADYAATVIGIAPNSAQAKGIQAQLATQQKERELASGEQTTRAAQYGQTLTAINSKWLAGGFNTKADYATALDSAEKAYGPGAGYKLPGANANVESGEPLPVPKPKVGEVAAPVVRAAPPPAAAAAIPPPAAGVVSDINLPDSLQPNTGNTPRKFNTAISYGTPTKLLDNLMATESSGQATGLNPDTKAMGAYQFLPETAVALHKKGIEFNPLNKQESRAAADWYLQDLLKKNDGDWNKTLAAYGGFKTKDPSDYIKKVTSGVDFSQPVEQPVKSMPAVSAAAAAAPAAPVAAAPVAAKTPEKVVLASPLEQVHYDPEITKGLIADNNKQAQAEFAQLGTLGAPNANKAAISNATNMIDFVKKNKTLHDESTNLLQNKDPGLWSEIKAQVKTAIDKGLTFAVGNPILSSMSVALPLDKMARAGLDPQHIKYIQNFANLAARVGVDQQRLFALNPNAISNKEADMYGALNANTNTAADNVITMGLHHREDVRALGDQWNFVNDVNQNRHPDVSLGKNVPDRVYTIMHSKPYGEIYDPYIAKHAQINEALQNAINRKSKP